MNQYDMSYYNFKSNEEQIRAHKLRVRVFMVLAVVLAVVELLK